MTVLIDKTKLNNIKILVSMALFDWDKSHDKFVKFGDFF